MFCNIFIRYFIIPFLLFVKYVLYIDYQLIKINVLLVITKRLLIYF